MQKHGNDCNELCMNVIAHQKGLKLIIFMSNVEYFGFEIGIGLLVNDLALGFPLGNLA